MKSNEYNEMETMNKKNWMVIYFLYLCSTGRFFPFKLITIFRLFSFRSDVLH